MQRSLYWEQKHVVNFLNKQLALLANKSSVNNFEDHSINKIQNLSIAKQVELIIPDSLITNNWDTIKKFAKHHHKVILKDIQTDSINIFPEKNIQLMISPKTRMITTDEVNLISKNFNSTSISKCCIIQQYIEKRYELRIFYLNGAFYPMAIFSQANEKTKIDFRNYDNERPNRCVPYKLPKDIEEKLDKFMKAADLNCGSIDMIYTPEGEYVFLEVNPVGQFQWLSKHCNYDIERLIAQTLMQNDGRRENTPRN